MFKVYDLNFREVALPSDELGYGILGTELYMSSIGRKVTYEDIPGMPGTNKVHQQDSSRTIDMRIIINAMNEPDYNLKRNRLFSFFRQIGDFYIAEEHEPNKLLKVSLDESYLPERPQGVDHWARIEIPLAVVGKPYRISRLTTLDIHNDNGLIRDGDWSRGMHLTRKLNDKQYVFNNVTDISLYNPSDIDLYVKQHLDCKITFECLQSMSRISLLDHLNNEFIFTDSLVAGDKVIIEGHRIKKNGTLAAAKFNDVYPTLVKGYSEVYQEYTMNKIKVNAGLKVTFDFRAKYD